MPEQANPFDLVKATDLSDEQIVDYFVDLPSGSSLLARINPASRMPMFIYGGKGSGKTHLMRYLSYPLQLRRQGGTLEEQRAAIERERYLGIYFRCGGLNAQRFHGKQQSDDVWQVVFAYYMELWLAQLVLSAVEHIHPEVFVQTPGALLGDIAKLFDLPVPEHVATLSHVNGHLAALQRSADIAINHAALTRTLDIQVHVTPGRLVFGLPAALAKHIPGLHSVLFLYLVDEFENLTEAQQRYLNTLLRERQDPCSFKVGVRLYGIRTRATLSAGEENRENSEFEVLRLDSELRTRPHSEQLRFAAELVRRRLVQGGYASEVLARDMDISEWFETLRLIAPSPSSRGDAGQDSPSLRLLRRALLHGFQRNAAPGVTVATDVDKVVDALRLVEEPLLERTSIFLLYRAWSRGLNLLDAAGDIRASATNSLSSESETEHTRALSHFRADIEAQLLRESKQRQQYLGFDNFVRMAGGLPRGLLTILKNVFVWSLFFGEKPFREGRISVRAQVEGIAQASEWFFLDARAPGPTGAAVRDAMTRLGELLRDLRFSDKPSECSLSTFSADLTATSETACRVLAEAVNWSMLLQTIGGQHDRNAGRVDDKYQVHPMLAPRWDLPLASRGALALSGPEVDSIFDSSRTAEFPQVRRRRVDAMTAPFFGRIPRSGQPSLPGLSDE